MAKNTVLIRKRMEVKMKGNKTLKNAYAESRKLKKKKNGPVVLLEIGFHVGFVASIFILR
jgi:hypothetical protein